MASGKNPAEFNILLGKISVHYHLPFAIMFIVFVLTILQINWWTENNSVCIFFSTV